MTNIDIDSDRVRRLQAAQEHGYTGGAADETTLFQRVMEASRVFVERFGGHLTPEGTTRKADEEYAEFKAALIDLSATDTTEDTRALKDEAARELIDTLVTLGGMAAAAGLTWTDIEAAAYHVLAKLDSRTVDTYAWDEATKLVVRKGRGS